MNSYFFKMNRQEKENILDQHKHVYDGYVTRYNQQSNQYPIYVQDLANDKNGITVTNKGNIKNYTNFNINESMLDTIGDGPMDLKNGTVDLDSLHDTISKNRKMKDMYYPSPNEDEEEFVTYGIMNDKTDDDSIMPINLDKYEYDIDELDDYSVGDDYDEDELDDLTYSERIQESLNFVDDEIVSDLVHQLYKSKHMFERFKNYN